MIYIDAGNTSIKVKHNGRLTRLSQEPEKELVYYLNQHLATPYVISSVRGEKFRVVIEQHCKSDGIWVETEKHFKNIENAYGDNYKHLGVDRWVCLVGAQALYPQKNICVIDSGTAITIDLLDANGKHIGGHIVPGLWSLYESLHANTANIKTDIMDLSIIKQKEQRMFGQDTLEGMVKGCTTMVESYITHVVKAIRQEFSDTNVLVTGGGNLNLHHIKHIKYPDLIFRGLEELMLKRASEN